MNDQNNNKKFDVSQFTPEQIEHAMSTMRDIERKRDDQKLRDLKYNTKIKLYVELAKKNNIVVTDEQVDDYIEKNYDAKTLKRK